MGTCFEKSPKKKMRVINKINSNNSNTNGKNTSTNNLNENNPNENNQTNINNKTQNKPKIVEENNDYNTNRPIKISKFKKGNNNNNNQNLQNNTIIKNNNINSNNAKIYNNDNNIYNNKINDDNYESENIKKSILKLKSEKKNNLHIQKTLIENTFNCNYKINLKITIKRVSFQSDFRIRN